MTDLLIVTDLDATLIGNDVALQAFNNEFQILCDCKGCKLVYATGRSLQLYLELESEYQHSDSIVSLIRPNMLITSVGSEIYIPDSEIDSGWRIDSRWEVHLSRYWDRGRIQEIVSQCEASRCGNLRLQAESEQGTFKISYVLEDPQPQRVLEDLRQRLRGEQENLRIQIIYSSDRNVDILPESSGKGNALNYVQQLLNTPHCTITCGDSGNDISLFVDENNYGIIVGNPRLELREWYLRNQRSNLYLATSNCAYGILEGLHRFGFIN
jgi:sucrose-6-phosphatase